MELNEVLLPTPNENLRIACGGNELVGMANLSYSAKAKLMRHIRTLDADYVLIDLGAGSSYNTLDFFMLSENGIIVSTPEPHARVDAYGFIKNSVYRKLRRHFNKNEEITNEIAAFARKDGRKSGRVSDLIKRLAAVDALSATEAYDLLQAYRPKLIMNRVRNDGYVRNDDKILDACERRKPILLHAPKASSSTDLYNVLMSGLHVPDRLHRLTARQARKLSQVAKAEAKFW